MSDLINEMAPVFALATTGFDAFYAEAQDKQLGYRSNSASSGEYSKAASSGDDSKSASSGDSSKSASSGYYSQSASSGYGSKSVSSGYYSNSASSGNYSKSASSGYGSTAASSGEYSTAASSGEFSACSALGYRAAVKGDLGNLLMASEYVDEKPIGGLAALVDGKILKPQCWYIVEGGKWAEVDFTDGVFSYVLKTTKGVKKVRTDSGEVLYVVGDGNGNFAHGKSIKEAREDLVYKITVKFEGDLPKSATGAEWVGIYRAATGACAAGCKEFVTRHGLDLSATYTVEQVRELTKGAFGGDKLAALKVEGR